MTTFDLEITQVQLKNHTKSHESKLRISNPEWYGIYVQMSGPQCRHCCCRHRLHVTCCCRRPHVTCCCRRHRTRVAVITHASLATAVVIAHASPSSPTRHLPLPLLLHTRRCRRCCCHCRSQVLVGGSPLLSLLSSLSLSSALPPSPCGAIPLSPKCAHSGLKRHTM